MATTTAADRRWATQAGAGPRRAPSASTAPQREARPETETPPRRNPLKSKKLLIVLIAVLAIGGGGYWFLLRPHPTPPPSGGDVVALQSTTLNLRGGHYLKIAMSIQLVKGAVSAPDFSTAHAAQLMIDEFSDRTVAAVSSKAARTRLRDELLAKIKHAYPGKVYAVFLTEFVTQ